MLVKRNHKLTTFHIVRMSVSQPHGRSSEVAFADTLFPAPISLSLAKSSILFSMTAPLLVTKLLPPTLVPATLPRQHLLDALDRGSHSRFFLICAPAGYGKTTLLRSWLGERRWGGNKTPHFPISPPPHFSWLTLDPADNDPRRFLTYFLAALRSLVPEIGSSIEPLLAGPQLPPLENIFVVLLNQIAAHSTPILLALDDYHEITNEAIHAGLSLLIDNCPMNLQIAMTSRSEPALPLSRWRVRRQLTELSSADLRFSAEEAAAFLQQSVGLTPTQEIARIIESKIEGWAAGLQLAALSIQGRRVAEPEQLASFLEEFSGGHRYIFDYLADEVLRHQPEAVQLFLRQTATFDRLSAALCDAATERSDSVQLLLLLERNGLFLSRIGERGEWFRYHALFAEFLRSQPCDHRNLIAQRAARWFAQQGLWSEAIHHALASGDLTFAGRMIADVTGYALSAGLIGELAGWLAALPDAQVRSDYQLSVAKGWVLYLMGQIPQAAEYLEIAVQQQPPGLAVEEIVAATALHAFIAAAQRNVTAALRYGREALEGIGAHNPALRSVILLNLAQVQWWLGDASALDLLNEALELSQQTGNYYGAVNALGTKVQILLIMGRLREAKQICEQALQKYCLPTGQFTPLAAIPLVNRGIVALEEGNGEEAETFLRQGIEQSQQNGSHVPLVSGNIALIMSLHLLGRYDEALEALYPLRAIAQNFGASAMVETLEAEIHLAKGDLLFVGQWVERIKLHSEDVPHYSQDPSYLVYAQWLIRQGQPEVALSLLQRIEQAARQQARQSSVIAALLLQCQALQALHNPEAARKAIHQALQLAAPENYRRPFLVYLHENHSLLRSFLPQYPHFITSLITSEPTPIFQSPNRRSLISNLPEPLSDREIDVLRLLANGLSNPEIADKLIVGVGTVKTHVHNILGKLGVRNRIEAIEVAKRLGVI